MNTEHNLEYLNRQPKWFKSAFYGAIILSVLFVVGMLVAPRVVRSAKKPDQTEAISNARQIGLALFGFEQEYGAFPNLTTIPLVEKGNDTRINLSGNSSNAYFRQLFAAQITQSEQMFYAKIKRAVKPDGDISRGHLLTAGECGFAYITGISSEHDPSTPIVLAPLIPGTRRFDPKPFKEKAVILKLDTSISFIPIGKDGRAISNGIDILSAKHPIWKGKAPVIHYPE